MPPERIWIAEAPKGGARRPVLVYTKNAAEAWEKNSYTVTGPYVLESEATCPPTSTT